MKPITCLLALIIFLPLYTKAQHPVEEQASSFTKTLKAKGIDTIISYHPYCIGYRMIISDTTQCQPSDTYYVMWSNKKQNFVRRFDDCNTYQDSTNKASAFFELLRLHFPQIKRERIKRVSFWDVYNGKRQLVYTTVDHSCHADFTFYIHSAITTKKIDYFNLETKFANAFSEGVQKPRNINYEYNQHTYLKRLLSIAEVIKKIKFNAAVN